MRKQIIKILILLIVAFPLFIQAQADSPDQPSDQPSPSSQSTSVTIDNPLQWNSFAELLNAVIDFLYNISLVLAPLMIVVGGYYFVTAATNPKQVETGKKIILWTLIGLLIIIAAKGLIALFGNIFGIDTPYN